MRVCEHGFYRWSINAFSFLRNTSAQYGKPMPSFDEPAISVGWVGAIAPHRVGIVGESLFVHCQVRWCLPPCFRPSFTSFCPLFLPPVLRFLPYFHRFLFPFFLPSFLASVLPL